MPVTPTYPGVYIQEIPSGVHAITGVPTAIAAFVGRALKGPLDTAVTINSFSDFGRIFGGMALGYPLGYSVRDFFANGGGQAIIVRIWAPPTTTTTTTPAATASLDIIAAISPIPALTLVASSPGRWGKALTAEYIAPPATLDPALLAALGYNDGELFSLIITDTASGVSETIRNVSIKEGSRRVDRVLAAESQLVVVAHNTSGNPILPTGLLPTASSSAPIQFDGGNDGVAITAATATAYIPTAGGKTGVHALDDADLFNLLCIPPDSASDDWKTTGALFAVYKDALAYCKSRRAFLIVDPPKDWTSVTAALAGPGPTPGLNLTANGDYGAVYFPHLLQSDPLKQGQIGVFPPSGAVAGIFARTDNERGVWKAPAGLGAGIVGAIGFDVKMTDAENGQLNPLGVNCLRAFSAAGNVVWGARTLRGADALTDDYKYVPVRRLALFLEESLFRGTKWVVFEPNDEPLWSQIRLNIGAFMNDLFKKGAFAGKTPKDAYLVKCDAETTTAYDQSIGVVNIVVGFAPLRPAEFVILNIQQLAGQTA
jgi:phage tail sheath protein FI